MIEIKGKYETAKVFTDNIDEASCSQILNLMNQEFAQGTHARFMPDVHAGKGCTIGTTMIVNDKICPNLIGVDIGCGMLVTKLGKVNIDLERFDKIVNQYVPSGFNTHDSEKMSIEELNIKYGVNLDDLRIFSKNDSKSYYLQSLGTLGGGNHFIELNKDSEDNIYLVIHSGSRNLGVKVCSYYQKLAIRIGKEFDSATKLMKDDLIKKLQSEGRHSEINDAIKAIKNTHIIEDLAYLDKASGSGFYDYLNDMIICQKYASTNRKIMAESILVNYFGLGINLEQFETIHNYIELPNNQSIDTILRKGAISAKAGEKVIIPLNMRDGSLICIGKGNPDWNFSGPHGAGRKMSRAQAKENVSLEEFKDSMKDVYSTSVGHSTIDESPMAYKDSLEIIENIEESLEIVEQIKPIYNFKAA